MLLKYNEGMSFGRAFLPIVLIIACSTPNQIPLGLVGGFTGPNSELGVSGRNGAILAVEEINASKSESEPRLVLLDCDDQGTEEGLRACLDTLQRRGARVVIGPYVSALGKAAVDFALAHDMFLISPTISSTAFDGRDDPLFRITPSLTRTSHLLSLFAQQLLGVRRLLILYDPQNTAYKESYLEVFLQREGTPVFEVTSELVLDNGRTDRLALARKVIEADPDAVLFLAPGRETALMLQTLRLQGYRGHILLSGWATTFDTVAWGGESLEGAYSAHTLSLSDPSPEMTAFRERYNRRFGGQPSFSSVYSYMAVNVAYQALKGRWTYPGWQRMRDWVLARGPYQSGIKTLEFSPYGDAQFSARVYVYDRQGKMIPVDF